MRSSWVSEKASLRMCCLSRPLRMCGRMGKGEGHDDEEDEKLRGLGIEFTCCVGKN